MKLENFNKPDIIVLNKDHKIFGSVKINKNQYCKKFNGKQFDLYFHKTSGKCTKI